jgi:hypothetical protein
MGIRGSATCQMSFGDNGNCIGELLGKPCQGIAVMFLIMNEERLNVGVQSVGLASAAYLNAREYAMVRKQGTDIRKKSASNEPVAIINHPDVRRNLLGMKAHVEGMRALNYYTAICIDMKSAAVDSGQRSDYDSLVEFLTPLCKAYSSIKGFDVCSSAMNVYGGYGYCQDYPVEQYLRDQKITALYEGTNAIHSIDLVSRKLGLNDGRALSIMKSQMQECIDMAMKIPNAAEYARKVVRALEVYDQAVERVRNFMSKGKVQEVFHGSMNFLEMTGDVIMAWMHLWQMTLAQRSLEMIFQLSGASTEEQKIKCIEHNREAAFYSGKVHSARYFIAKLLPLSEALAVSFMTEDYPALEIHDVSF